MKKDLWKTKDIKKSGRNILKNNFSTLVMVSLFLTLIFGGSIGNRTGYSVFTEAFEQIQNVQNYRQTKSEKEVIKDSLDKILSQYLSGNMNGFIKEYNEKNNVYSGFMFSAFNFISNSEAEIQNFVKSISEDESKIHAARAALIIFTSIGIFIRILLINPISVGEKRLFLESIYYKKTKLWAITYPFKLKKKRYKKTAETMLTVRFYQLLWNITIIGGAIKHYSYLMVPYIIAENPHIDAKDAIKMSQLMMNGNKWKAFLTDLTFLGWEVLNILTLGLVGLYYSPYYMATYAALYAELRKEYKKEELYKFELLNDEKLFNNPEKLDVYPEDVSKKKEYSLFRIYDFVDIVLMFFVFSIAGWFMEMNLFYFLEGTLVNRGALYGPWLPIYGFGCGLIILLLNIINMYNKSRFIKKIEENPFIVFIIVMILCSFLEYMTSYVIEMRTGLKYWDYSGHFMNINGRICLENSLFFGVGGCLCIYIIAPFLQRMFSKIPYKTKIYFAVILSAIMFGDATYSHFVPHTGNLITFD
jgi:uncharacterized membrane protein